MADIIAMTLFFGSIAAGIAFYLITIIDLHRSQFYNASVKARLLTFIWLFPLFGCIYYWYTKRSFLKVRTNGKH